MNAQRWVSVVAGTALAAFGLRRRSLGGLALAGLGGGLVWRGLAKNGHAGPNVSVPYGRGIRVEKSVTINAPPDAIAAAWRDSSLVEELGPIEIINEIPNELIGWRSIDDSTFPNAGSVHFTPAPGNRGTEVKVILSYDPPGGKVGAKIAKLFGEHPSQRVQDELRELKQMLEAGEIATTAGQPWGAES